MQSLNPLNRGMKNFFRSGEEQSLAMTDVMGKEKSKENGLHIK